MKNRTAETIIIFMSFALIGVAALYNYNDRRENATALKAERLKNDSILGEKQLLDKELFMMKKDFESLKNQKEILEQQLLNTKSTKK